MAPRPRRAIRPAPAPPGTARQAPRAAPRRGRRPPWPSRRAPSPAGAAAAGVGGSGDDEVVLLVLGRWLGHAATLDGGSTPSNPLSGLPASPGPQSPPSPPGTCSFFSASSASYFWRSPSASARARSAASLSRSWGWGSKGQAGGGAGGGGEVVRLRFKPLRRPSPAAPEPPGLPPLFPNPRAPVPVPTCVCMSLRRSWYSVCMVSSATWGRGRGGGWGVEEGDWAAGRCARLWGDGGLERGVGGGGSGLGNLGPGTLPAAPCCTQQHPGAPSLVRPQPPKT
jgi:hypothetical protein